MDNMGSGVHFLNRDYPSDRGILDLWKYISKIDVIFLNWIEDLPDKKGGVLQSLFFILMTWIMKVRKTTIIWVMHNKESHYDTNRVLKDMLFRFVQRKSDYIITHSREGLHILDNNGVNSKKKARYYPHPLVEKSIPSSDQQVADILIWGSIIPYKGIDKFLDFLYTNNLEKKYNIVIAGKVSPPEYEATIKRFLNDHIQLDNRYVPDEVIAQYMAEIRVVLFTYDGGSVLSSGALMDSLSTGVNILAPHVGAFKDAQEEGLIATYRSFEELIELLDKDDLFPENRRELIRQFIGENNWEQFSMKVTHWIFEGG